MSSGDVALPADDGQRVLMGTGSAAISSLLVIAQGAAAIVFSPCMRA